MADSTDHSPPEAPAGPSTARLIAVYGAATLALLLIYVTLARWYTGVPWSLPLDDPFIYLQYARQTAAGHFLAYNTGDPPTSGSTSLLYALLLVPGFWLGLDGLAMVPYLLLLGLVGLAGSAVVVHRLAGRWLGGPWGWWAGMLLLLSGPVCWGAFSGMEIALFMLLILWLLERADRVLAGHLPIAQLLPAASLVAIWRPEGWLLVAVLAAVVLVARRGSGIAWLLLVPLAIGCLPGLLIWLAGGTWTPAGVTAKSLWSGEPLELPEVVRLVLGQSIEILKGVFGGSLGDRTSERLLAYDMNARAVFFAPFTLALFTLGIMPRAMGELRERRPGVGTLVALWFSTLLLSTASLVEADAHFNRYQMPIMPLFLLGATLGAVTVGGWVRRAVGRDAGDASASAQVAPALLVVLLLFGIASTAVFAVHYGDNASDIDRMQVTMARVIDERLPPDAVVAINDAGILRYLSHRRTLDLVGLTSPDLARIWREGSGSLVEHFETMPEHALPSHFAIFPNWFQLTETGLLEPMHAVVLQTPSIVDAEKVLYAANWHALRRDDAPCNPAVVPPGHVIVDGVDVADLDDEAAHAWRSWQRERGADLKTVAFRARCGAATGDSAHACVDGVRVLMGGAAMRVAVQPGREVGLMMRTRGGVRQRFEVRWDGVPVATPDFKGPEGAWDERVLVIVPPGLVTRPRSEITLIAGTEDGARRPLLPGQLWITQPGVSPRR